MDPSVLGAVPGQGESKELTRMAVYGGVIDVLLALFPFFIIRNLLLDLREKIALTFAMSIGAVTGTIVIFRAFYQLKQLDNDFGTSLFPLYLTHNPLICIASF